MTLTTRDMTAADLESLRAFAGRQLVAHWNPATPDLCEFLRLTGHLCIKAAQARAQGEAGEMVMDLSTLNPTGRAELADLAGKLRGEACAEGNCVAAEFFARIEAMLEAESATRRELERIFELN